MIPFHKNKYTRWYYLIIRKAKDEKRIRLPVGNPNRIYYESHHIIPKCMGGTETILLTAKEHFICHLLLTKMTDDYRMKYAFGSFLGSKKDKKRESYRINSSIYSHLRKCYSIAVSEKHKGKVTSEETKQKQRNAQLGKPKKKHSEESKEKMRLSRSQQIFSKESHIKRGEAISKALARKWLITFPDKHTEIITNLKRWCIVMELSSSHLVQVSKGKLKQHKGFLAEKLAIP